MADKGLQPVCLFLAVFPSLLCIVIVSVRLWTRARKKLFGLGGCSSKMGVESEADNMTQQRIRYWSSQQSVRNHSDSGIYQ